MGLQHPRCRWISPPSSGRAQAVGVIVWRTEGLAGCGASGLGEEQAERRPLGGRCGCHEAPGQGVTGPLSDGSRGEGTGLPQRGEGLRGAGAQVAPPPCPAFLLGGSGPSTPHLLAWGALPSPRGTAPCPAPPKLPRSPGPSSQACSPPPLPRSRVPSWAHLAVPTMVTPWPTVPTSIWTVYPSADDQAPGLLLPWAHTPQPWAAPAPHPAQVPLGLLFDMHAHAHTRPGPAHSHAPSGLSTPLKHALRTVIPADGHGHLPALREQGCRLVQGPPYG